MAVEAFVWRTYEETLPPDAVELDIDGHRAAQYWMMKPTDWNNRWWITCAIAFDTSYGVIQQTLFYSPIYSEPDPDCMQTNLQRAHELAPYYSSGDLTIACPSASSVRAFRWSPRRSTGSAPLLAATRGTSSSPTAPSFPEERRWDR